MSETNSDRLITWQGIKKNIYYRLIRPFKVSSASIHEISLGAAVGMFWALTPLLGVQIPITTLNWFVFRFLRWDFYLPISLALLWITNAFSAPFFYYLFYVIGVSICGFTGCDAENVGIGYFDLMIEKTVSMGFWDKMYFLFNALYRTFGYPLFVGGFIVGSISSLITYPLTYFTVLSHRKKLAKDENISLEEWTRKHVIRKI